MIPIKVTLSGFMSYREAQTLDFSDDPLWVLVGKNASGKSSIFDAIIFSLFDEKRIDGVTQEDLVNHLSDRAEIIFDFQVGSTHYRVKRTINKNGGSTRQAWVVSEGADGAEVVNRVLDTHKEANFKQWVENDLGLNFQVFTTSVLLRQGQADAFLNAPPKDRYTVLEKLIDLSKYRDLAERAVTRKRECESEEKAASADLARITPVTEEGLAQARQRILDGTQLAKDAELHEAELMALYEQAHIWGGLNAELTTCLDQADNIRQLLARADEITRGYQRWSELRGVLPGLREVLRSLADVAAEDSEIRRLAGEIEKASRPLIQTEALVKSLEVKAGQIQDQDHLISTRTLQVNARLGELTATIRQIARIGEIQGRIREHQVNLSAFPQDLDDQLRIHSEERDSLLDAQRAAPELSRLMADRLFLANAGRRRATLEQKIAQNEQLLPGRSQAREDARVNLNLAEAREKKARIEQANCGAALSAAQSRLHDFNSVASEPKCRYCGQDLTPAHIKDERATLENELQNAQDCLDAAITEYRLAEQGLIDTRAAFEAAKSNLGELEGEIRDDTGELDRLKSEIDRHIQSIQTTYHSLPDSYRMRVALQEPESSFAWVQTVFPVQADVEKAVSGAKKLATLQAEVSALTTDVRNRDMELRLLAREKEALSKEQDALPLDWQDAQSENERLLIEKKQLADRSATLSNDSRTNQRELTSTRLDHNRKREEQIGRQSTLDVHVQTLERTREKLGNQISSLPESWQPYGRNLTKPEFEALRGEMDELTGVETQYQELATAGQSLRDLDARARKAHEGIDQLLEAARRPANIVGQELSAARSARDQAKTALGLAETRLHDIEEQQRRYVATEALKNSTHHKALLYATLAERFGERGIQKEIIQQAERSIVRLSNQMLDNLSGGRSKLKLRDGDGTKKALDLEVLDAETGGGRPILVGLASGSQRFRIAISLALGIGQYIGHESHKIESVIIDEGFGSLDKEGRESVIQELINLSRHLKRIILVSHQEEFSRGFTTGYEILLADGASQVRPLLQ